MNHRRLVALERILLCPRPTCPCLLTFCPEEGEIRPLLDVVCDRCGLWRDPQTARIVEVIVVETREDVEASRVNATRQEQ